MTYRNLLLGCGHARLKRVSIDGSPEWNGELVTMDMSPDVGADIVCELDGRKMLPLDTESFDEIHAYDSLEHWGKQGDWRGWFDEFADYWRVLKPGGKFCCIIPIGSDWFADPGHVRFISANYFRMLDRSFIAECLAEGKPVTDYRWYWKRDFAVVYLNGYGEPPHHLAVILEKR